MTRLTLSCVLLCAAAICAAIAAPIHDAAIVGDVEQLAALVGDETNLDERDETGRTPLHCAVATGAMDAAAALLQWGADPDARNADGDAPIHVAVAAGDDAMVELLIHWGANVGARDGLNNDPCDVARNAGQLSAGYLVFAAQMQAAAIRGDGTELRRLAGCGLGAAPVDLDGWTPLHWAAWAGREESVIALIESGHPPDAAAEDGRTPLHIAAECGNAEAARALLDRTTYREPTDDIGATPLHYAAVAGRQAMADLLIAYRSQPSAKTRRGATPLDWSTASGQSGTAGVIRAKGGTTGSLPVAPPSAPPAAEGQPFQARVIDVVDGDTLVVAANGHSSRIRLEGIDCPEGKQTGGDQAAAFTAAAVYGHLVTISPTDTDRYGRTVARVAAENGASLNESLVANGMAWWCREYAPSDSTLAALEKQAREQGLGIWDGGEPVPPWEFRAAQRGTHAAKYALAGSTTGSDQATDPPARRRSRARTSASSQGYSSGAQSSAGAGGPVHVRGYYRKDGTYVRPHTRSRPKR